VGVVQRCALGGNAAWRCGCQRGAARRRVRAAQVEGPDGLATQDLLDACLGVLAGSLEFTTWDNVQPTAIANISVCSPPSAAGAGGRRRLLTAAPAYPEPYASLDLQLELDAKHAAVRQLPALRFELERDGAAVAPGGSTRGRSGRAPGPVAPRGLAAPGAPGPAGAWPGLPGAPAARPAGPGEMLGSARRARALAEADAAAGAVRRARGAREALWSGRPGAPHRGLAAAAGAAAPQPQPADGGGGGGGGACENRTMVAIRMDLKVPVNATDVNNKARPLRVRPQPAPLCLRRAARSLSAVRSPRMVCGWAAVDSACFVPRPRKKARQELPVKRRSRSLTTVLGRPAAHVPAAVSWPPVWGARRPARARGLTGGGARRAARRARADVRPGQQRALPGAPAAGAAQRVQRAAGRPAHLGRLGPAARARACAPRARGPRPPAAGPRTHFISVLQCCVRLTWAHGRGGGCHAGPGTCSLPCTERAPRPSPCPHAAVWEPVALLNAGRCWARRTARHGRSPHARRRPAGPEDILPGGALAPGPAPGRAGGPSGQPEQQMVTFQLEVIGPGAQARPAPIAGLR